MNVFASRFDSQLILKNAVTLARRHGKKSKAQFNNNIIRNVKNRACCSDEAHNMLCWVSACTTHEIKRYTCTACCGPPPSYSYSYGGFSPRFFLSTINNQSTTSQQSINNQLSVNNQSTTSQPFAFDSAATAAVQKE